MFKKFSKNLFTETPTPVYQNLAERPTNPFSTDLMNAIEPQGLEEEIQEPETVIAANVSIKGTMSFEKLLQIDGNFEGELLSSGKLIVGPTGSVKANIQLEEAFISGKVVGDITVQKRLVLRGRAEVHGNVTAPLLSVDEGVSIVGILNIAQPASSAVETEEEMDHYSSDH